MVLVQMNAQLYINAKFGVVTVKQSWFGLYLSLLGTR